MKRIAIILLLAALSLGLSARGFTQYYFQFEVKDKAELRNISNMISIDNVKGNWVFAYANDDEWKAFQELGYKTRLLPAPSSLIEPVMSRSVGQAKLWDSYPTYETYVSMMYAFASSYPNLCQIVDAGTTVNGRQILFAKISDNVSTHEAEPEVLYTSTMHGDETVSYILMLRLIDTLLSSYGSNPRITNIVNSMELWISPNTNPDGTYYGGNSSVSGARRANANGYDLNRNYPDPSGNQYSGAPRQIETTHMINLANSKHFVFGANFHGGAEVVNYPWDLTYTLHPDDAWYQTSSFAYANSAKANGPSGYFTGIDASGITNGAVWYLVDGGRQDWMNYTVGCREVTIEVSNTKLPAASTLPNYWNYNYDAMLSHLEQSLYGVHGIVTDYNGNPLSATISVAQITGDYTNITTDPAHGDFYRYLNPGTYTFTISASGFPDKVINNVVVNANSKTTLNVVMGEAPHSQSISLQPGWNLMSFNIDLGANTFNSVFDANLRQIKDNRQTYSPQMASHFNTLPALSTAKGYWVNNNSSSTLNITGQLLNSGSNPQSLNAGWNLVAYLPDTAMSVSSAFSSISSQLQEVRDINSSWIAGSGGSLSQLSPGKAYWVKVSTPCTLLYP